MIEQLLQIADKRRCYQCSEHIPPETDHIVYDDDVYCTNCIEKKPYTAYYFELSGEWIGDEDSDHVQFVESYDDDYYEDEEEEYDRARVTSD